MEKQENNSLYNIIHATWKEYLEYIAFLKEKCLKKD